MKVERIGEPRFPYDLTHAELKVVRSAVRSSLDLRQRYVGLFTEDKKMQRKQVRLRNEIPLLKSALAQLKGNNQ